jgi:hypothetical protein
MPNDDKDWQTRMAAAEAHSAAIAAETKALEAEAANIRARKELETTQASLDPAKVAEAQRLAQARQVKELAEAGSAEQQAKINSLKAAVGAFSASPIEGKVELGDKAGQMESALLSTKAMITTASQVAAAVAKLATKPTAILVVPHGEMPDLKGLYGLRSFVAIMTLAFINANRSLESALSDKEMPGLELAGVPGVGGVGLALEAVSKLLGYFRTDYAFGGTESTEDQLALAELVAGRLCTDLPNTHIYLHSVYAGNAATTVTDFVTDELEPLAELHQQSLDRLDRAMALLATSSAAPLDTADVNTPAPTNGATTPADSTPTALLSSPNSPGAAGAAASGSGDATSLVDATEERTALPAPTPTAQIPPPHAARDAHVRAAADRLGKLVAIYQTAVDKLMAENGMDTLARQYALEAKLKTDNSRVLVTRLHKAGGSHYVTKNLWNLFGFMPFKVMGGAIASYSLFDWVNGELLQSETYAVHGGFKAANKLS